MRLIIILVPKNVRDSDIIDILIKILSTLGLLNFPNRSMCKVISDESSLRCESNLYSRVKGQYIYYEIRTKMGLFWIHIASTQHTSSSSSFKCLFQSETIISMKFKNKIILIGM